MSDLLIAARICERLGVSRWTWRRWVKTGAAPAPVDHMPGVPRWRRSDVERFAAGTFRAPGRRTYFSQARQLRAEASAFVHTTTVAATSSGRERQQ